MVSDGYKGLIFCKGRMARLKDAGGGHISRAP